MNHQMSTHSYLVNFIALITNEYDSNLQWIQFKCGKYDCIVSFGNGLSVFGVFRILCTQLCHILNHSTWNNYAP